MTIFPIIFKMLAKCHNYDAARKKGEEIDSNCHKNRPRAALIKVSYRTVTN